MKGKKLLFVVSSLLIVLAAGALSLGNMPAIHPTEKIAFTIDHYAVSEREFQAFLQSSKALTTSYFKRTYNAEYDKDFWTASFNGENPLAYAKQKAMDELVKVKTEQIIMKENGIVSDISYEAFLKSYDRENKDRARKVANHEPIYGPKQYGKAEYYSYYQSMNVQKLIDKWTKEAQRTLTDEELKLYYDKVKQQYFHRGYTFDYEKISFNSQTDLKEELWSEMIQAASSGNITLVEAAASLGVQASTEKLTLNLAETSKEDTLSQNLYTEFLASSEGDYSDIYQSGEGMYRFRLLVKRDKGLEKYEDVKNAVIQLYVQERLQDDVSRRLKQAQVETNKEVFPKITFMSQAYQKQ
ncbi:peptidylprolyl isomerase [Paenibacillus paridis]|uniref:peptidylprolyl isomerase n=1 Tax=Paenibacillus paridis TaxID=2583376 RepID=UPI00111FD3E3|nr:peptidylprolyl isomerase [Paenibacillus paridis]